MENNSTSDQNTSLKSNFVEYKVILCGDACVGKTSILFRYIRDSFSDIQFSTVSSQGYVKEIDLRNGKPPVRLSIWDTAGQEQYNSMVKVFFREADAVIMVYDITNENSFSHLKKWHELSSSNCPEYSIFYIVGNKIDLPEEQYQVDGSKATEMQKNLGASACFTCSAKSGEGVKELFESIANAVINMHREISENIDIRESNPKRKKCC